MNDFIEFVRKENEVLATDILTMFEKFNAKKAYNPFKEIEKFYEAQKTPISFCTYFDDIANWFTIIVDSVAYNDEYECFVSPEDDFGLSIKDMPILQKKLEEIGFTFYDKSVSDTDRFKYIQFKIDTFAYETYIKKSTGEESARLEVSQVCLHSTMAKDSDIMRYLEEHKSRV